MAIKYDLNTLDAAARLGITKELSASGVLYNYFENVLTVDNEHEELVEGVIAKFDTLSEALEALQQEARDISMGLSSPSCEFCGRKPAAMINLKRQVGMVVVMSTYRAEVMVCGPCGDAAYREFQKQTAIKGWTGVRSALFNPVVLSANAVNIKKHRESISRLERENQ